MAPADVNSFSLGRNKRKLSEMIVNSLYLIEVYVTFLKTQWNLIEDLCISLHVNCLLKKNDQWGEFWLMTYVRGCVDQATDDVCFAGVGCLSGSGCTDEVSEMFMVWAECDQWALNSFTFVLFQNCHSNMLMKRGKREKLKLGY